jgi:hypothetical protein
MQVYYIYVTTELIKHEKLSWAGNALQCSVLFLKHPCGGLLQMHLREKNTDYPTVAKKNSAFQRGPETSAVMLSFNQNK